MRELLLISADPKPLSLKRLPKNPPLFSNVRRDLAACRCSGHLHYYSHLASKLTFLGRLHDFLLIAETVLAASSKPASLFLRALDVELITYRIVGFLRDGKLQTVTEALGKPKKLGVLPLNLLDEWAKEAIAEESPKLLDQGRLEEFVALVESLAGYGFSVKDFVEPLAILSCCVENVENCDPHLSAKAPGWVWNVLRVVLC